MKEKSGVVKLVGVVTLAVVVAMAYAVPKIVETVMESDEDDYEDE